MRTISYREIYIRSLGCYIFHTCISCTCISRLVPRETLPRKSRKSYASSQHSGSNTRETWTKRLREEINVSDCREKNSPFRFFDSHVFSLYKRAHKYRCVIIICFSIFASNIVVFSSILITCKFVRTAFQLLARNCCLTSLVTFEEDYVFATTSTPFARAWYPNRERR